MKKIKKNPSNKNYSILSGKINKIILYRILAFSSILTLILTAFTLNQEYVSKKKSINQKIAEIIDYSIPLLTHSMWVYDRTVIKTLVNSIEKQEHIGLIKIVDENNKIIHEVGNIKLATTQVAETHPLIFTKSNGGEKKIGEMLIYIDMDNLYKEIIIRIHMIFFEHFSKTILVSIFILFLVNYYVSNHLVASAKLLGIEKKNLDSGDVSKLKKNIILNKSHEDDELDDLIDSLNSYRKKIADNFIGLLERKNFFENEVKLQIAIQKELVVKNKLVNNLFDVVQLPIIIINADFNIVMVNKKTEQKTGLYSHEIIGKNINKIVQIKQTLNDSTGFSKSFLRNLLQAKKNTSSSAFCSFSGKSAFPATITIYPIFNVEERMMTSLIIDDISQDKAIESIRYNANHDYMTGLHNRLYFEEKVREIKENPQLCDKKYTIGLIDLDGFKTINDLFGHMKGDEILVRVAKIIKLSWPEDSIVIRRGGDEFAFLVNMKIKEVRLRAKKLLKLIKNEKFYHDNKKFNISASIGIREINLSQLAINEVIGMADFGCHQSKNSGGDDVNEVKVESAGSHHNKKFLDFHRVEKAKKLILNKKIVLFRQKINTLQPKIELPSRQEILIRIQGDNKYLLPSPLIDALNSARLMHLLDNYVLESLIDFFENNSAIDSECVHVNISPLSFLNIKTQENFINLIKSARNVGVKITFEITEDALISQKDRIKEVVEEIIQLGGETAIDDFGKGYASYGYISDLKISMIKLDGNLIRGLTPGSQNFEIIKSVQSVADSIGAITVAECPENEYQCDLLRNIGVHYSQSFIHHQPESFELSLPVSNR